MRTLSSHVNPRATGSKFLTCAAILVLKSDTSNSVTRRTAEMPLVMPCQQASLPTPLGEIIPIPVTTTLRFLFILFLTLQSFVHQIIVAADHLPAIGSFFPGHGVATDNTLAAFIVDL